MLHRKVVRKQNIAYAQFRKMPHFVKEDKKIAELIISAKLSKVSMKPGVELIVKNRSKKTQETILLNIDKHRGYLVAVVG